MGLPSLFMVNTKSRGAITVQASFFTRDIAKRECRFYDRDKSLVRKEPMNDILVIQRL